MNDWLKELTISARLYNIMHLDLHGKFKLMVDGAVVANNNEYLLSEYLSGSIQVDLFILDLCYNSLGGEINV